MVIDRGVPLPLRPVIRLRVRPGEGDAYARMLRCYAMFLPHYTETELRGQCSPAEAAAPLLDLSDGEMVLAHLSEPAKSSLRAHANVLTRTLEPYAPNAAACRISVTCLRAEQHGFAAGTVVMERASELMTEQYIFPHVRIDLISGQPRLVGLARSPSVTPAYVQAMGDLQPVRTGISVVLSVTPFLPPPWGAAATGILTVLNMIFASVDKSNQPHTSPYVQLREQLEDFVIENDLRHDHGILLDVNTEFTTRTKTLTTPLDQLTSWDNDLVKLQDYIEHEALPKVRAAASDIWTILESRTTHNCGTALSLMVGAIDLRLLVEGSATQLEALQAFVAQKNNHLDEFNSLAKTWMEHVNTISELIGQHTDPASWTDESIKKAITDDPWIPRVEAWMEKAKRDRLAKISSQAYRYMEPFVDNYAHAWVTRKEGWTWKDTDLPEQQDQQEYGNAAFDTYESCCGATQHKGDADFALSIYRGKISTQADAVFADAQKSVQGWLTYIDAFKELIPYSTPTAKLQAAPKKDGPGLPRPPFWVEGARMQYALVAVNSKGPSLRGPWSDELKVTGNAFATLTGFPPLTNIDSLRIMRQVLLPGGHWGYERTVALMLPPGTAQLDDTNDDD